MFDNLNNTNSSGSSTVDDIFAETDKTVDSPRSPRPTEITTQHVGLSASENTPPEPSYSEPKSSGSGFKIVVIIMVVAIVGLLGFLAYSKFFQNNSTIDETLNNPSAVGVNSVNNQNVNTNQPSDEALNTQNNPDDAAFVDSIPGSNSDFDDMTTTTINTPEEDISTSSTAIQESVAPIDSDSDGLTDEEEMIAKTSINLIDTDNDGLSDYEEVKIYKTNPTLADTDGDSFNDGQEVRGGYNPNGAGKLPGNLIK